MKNAARIVADDGGTIRYIQATENGERAWYLLELYPEYYAEYKKKLKTGTLQLTEFGKIIACGVGETAPADVLKRYNIK